MVMNVRTVKEVSEVHCVDRTAIEAEASANVAAAAVLCRSA